MTNELYPSAVELTLTTGVKCRVYPLAAWDNQALLGEARVKYPAPDPKEYEVLVDPEIASVPGQVHPATSNPLFIEAMQECQRQWNQHVTDGMLALCVTFNETPDVLIERYKPMLDHKRRRLTLPENAWAATLKHGILADNKDVADVLAIAQGQMPLTEGEIADGVRLFRPASERSAVSRVSVRRGKSPSAQASEG